MKERTYIAIDLKSFYASVECRERGLDPLDTNLVVADESRTDKTICMVVMNQNDPIQTQIAHQAQVDGHASFVIHLDAVDDAAQLGIRHLAHVGDALDVLEGLV